ncbi:MAG: 16S rRNA (cytosine(1402)-N(4))-methyltransferase RsmH [Lachnospiraceae bacterium]|nr:16S rRNA (cytosine(1402)-N(4))-methyltransferase RsmH [Lachnospiraceae bacterium]
MTEKEPSFSHTSVLLEEVIEGLNIKPDGIYADGTLGGAGHSCRIAEKLSPKGRLIGIDQDEAAIKAASQRLSGFGDICTIVRSNYENMAGIFQELGLHGADGILLDLGVSSYQLDTPERGFSYKTDAPLDMRMDQRNPLTAEIIINEYPQEELARILREYGEEKFAGNIARHIVAARQKQRITTTEQLNELIRDAIPAKMRRTGGHPSKRTFQAIRIACNRELEVLETALEDMIRILLPGGRLCVITFHSLEDRIVKTAFKRAENPCICPPGFPVCTCGRESLGRCVGRKPILPTEEETENNPRAKSAKLRIFEKRN